MLCSRSRNQTRGPFDFLFPQTVFLSPVRVGEVRATLPATTAKASCSRHEPDTEAFVLSSCHQISPIGTPGHCVYDDADPVSIHGKDSMGLSIPNLNRTAVIGDESEQARASRGPAYRPDPGCNRGPDPGCNRGLVGCDLLAVVGIEDVDISSAILYILLIPNSNQTPIRGPGQTCNIPPPIIRRVIVPTWCSIVVDPVDGESPTIFTA